MSSDAVGWTFRHSPYKGSRLAIHLAAADSVNDQNGNELWMAATNLAKKARCSRRSTTDALGVLVEDGYLTLLEERIGKPSRYRFEFPPVDVVFESRPPPRPAQPLRRSRRAAPAQPEPGPAQPDAPDLRNQQHGPAQPLRTNPREPKEEQPKRTQALAATPPSEHHEASHSLAQFAFEQDPKPNTRGGFVAVMARCEEALTAGWTADQVAYVIRHGLVGAWTKDSLSLALNKAKQMKNGNGYSRSAVLSAPDQPPIEEAWANLYRDRLPAAPAEAELGTGR